MNLPEPLRARLRFLARVISREMQHLQGTDDVLFAVPFDAERVNSMEQDQALAERVDAFVARFGRLQDNIGDKLLPAWREAVGETPSTAADNLDRAERLGLIPSANDWLSLRRLRNQMIHEYLEDPEQLARALQYAHRMVPMLLLAAQNLLRDLEERGILSTEAE